MNLSLVGRHIELTDAIKDHINASIDSLNKYNLDIISINAIASSREKHGKPTVSIEFTINLAAKNTIVIKQSDDDLYAAVDIAIDRAQKALRRISDRDSDHRNESLNEAKNEASVGVNLSDAAEAQEDEIVPVELDMYKPKEAADVIEALKSSDKKQFEVYMDNENKMRVMFKRNDGRFGLY